MNRLKPERQKQIIACLVEGNSIRGTSRLTGADTKTIMKLLGEIGQACSDYQDKAFRDLECKRIQFSIHDWFHCNTSSQTDHPVRELHKKTWELVNQKVKEENLNIERIIDIFHTFVDLAVFPQNKYEILNYLEEELDESKALLGLKKAIDAEVNKTVYEVSKIEEIVNRVTQQIITPFLDAAQEAIKQIGTGKFS